MHFCKVNVAIGGDRNNIMHRDEYAPVSWPEVEVLREIHGADAISEVAPFVDVKQTARAERERLVLKYGDEVLAQRWGGKNAPDELTAQNAKLPSNVVWMNPLSGQMEKTGKSGKTSEPYTPPVEKRSSAEVVGNYAVREAEAEEAEIEEAVPEAEEPAPVEVEEAPTDEEEEEKVFGSGTLKKPARKK